MTDDDRHLPGLGNVAIISGGALVALLIARRLLARERDIDEPRNGHSRPVLGSFGAEIAVQLFEDAAASARGDGVDAGALRNRGRVERLAYRPVGATGERYPDWLQDLRGKSGVYVIRDRRTAETLYVGESHAGRLYETLTRHLQRWKRWKAFWRDQYAESDHDPGVTYDRASVEVAARVLSPERALDEEARLIRTLKPRDNVNRVEVDDVPF